MPAGLSLSAAGVISGTPTSGANALAQIAESKPDLLLADVGLEGEIDGIAVASVAREQWETPTVFLTAYSDAETMRRATFTEPYGYLVKPFAEQELHATIEIALQQCGLAAARKQRVQSTNHLLVRTQEELNTVTARLFSAQEEERERIARDLHDDLGHRLALLQMDLEKIRGNLPAVLRDELSPVAQDSALATTARPLNKSDGRIEWSQPAAKVHDHARGMTPWPGAFTRVGGRLLKVLATRHSSFRSEGDPGTIIAADTNGVLVACAEGTLEIVRAQVEGKKPLAARELVLGRTLTAGARFE